MPELHPPFVPLQSLLSPVLALSLGLVTLGCGDDGPADADPDSDGGTVTTTNTPPTGTDTASGSGDTLDDTGGAAGPLQLDLAQVISTRYEDCVEPTLAPPQPPLVEDGPMYLEPGTPQLPPGWTINDPECSLTEEGLTCTGAGYRDVLVYDGPPMFVALSARASDIGTELSIPGVPGERRAAAQQDGGRVTIIVPISSGSELRKDPAFGSLFDLQITPITAQDIQPANNARLLLGTEQQLVGELGPDIGGLPYLSSVTLPEGEYALGQMCFDKRDDSDNCDDRARCSWFFEGEPVEGNFEWDSSIDPFEQGFKDVERIRSAAQLQPRAAGEYFVACQNPGRGFVRTYDHSLVRSCNFVTWFFDLAQGDEPVVDLDVEALTPSVNDEQLDVEAGARLSQDNLLRIGLLLDRSFSITAADATESVRSGARSFVDAMPPGTIFSVHEFASEDQVPLALQSQPFRDLEPVYAALDDYAPWPVSNSMGFTKLLDATGNTTIDGFRPWPFHLPDPVNYAQLPKTIVVFTDGDDTASTLFTNDAGEPDAAAVRQQLRECQTDVAAIGLGDEIQQATLEDLADDQVFFAPQSGDLEAAFADVAHRLTTRYRFKMLTPEYIEIDGVASLSASYDGELAVGSYTAPEGTCGAVR